MFGLLDLFSTDDPGKQARLAQSLALLEAGGPSRTPVSLFQGLGMAGRAGLEAKRQAQQDAYRKTMQDMQLQQLTMQQQEAKRKQAQEALQQQTVNGMNPMNTGPVPQPQMDAYSLLKAGLLPATEYMKTMQPKEPKYQILGNQLLRTDTPTPQVAFTGADKPDLDALIIQGPNGPMINPLAVEAKKQIARAGASNITNYGAPVAAIGPDGKPAFIQPSRTGGAPSVIPGFSPPPSSGNEPSEGERKAATLLQRLRGSQKQLNDVVGADPGAASPSLVPSAVGTMSGTAANLMTSSNRQQVEAAQLDMLDAALTLGTGAAYTKEQLEGYRKSYFPQIGDSPANVKAKQARLQNVITAAEVAAGRAGVKLPKSPTSHVDDLVNKYRSK